MKKFVGEEQYRSKGIGKMATFLFLYYSFRILNFNKVYLHSLDTNINNINLNSKFGFELEGILYKEVFLHNAHRDVLRMGLLRDKWAAIFSEEQELFPRS
jgi:RimJ/RimL family protein N-acetyltransferase